MTIVIIIIMFDIIFIVIFIIIIILFITTTITVNTYQIIIATVESIITTKLKFSLSMFFSL